MDRIEESAESAVSAPGPSVSAGPTSLRGSQSKVPGLLFWLLAAALLFRIGTAIFDRGGKDSGEGLVHWQSGIAAPSVSARFHRPLLYDFTAAWCAPCHLLDSEGWADPAIAAIVNGSFVPARVVDRSREDGTNLPWIAELQQRYSVSAFPTLVVADSSGRELARMEGYMGKERLVKFLEDAGKKAGK
jgi:thiol:disulfide interchange protein